MKANQLLLILVCVTACGLVATNASATLVAQVDYSDTFTVGGSAARTDGNLIAYGGAGGVTDPVEYTRAGLPAAAWAQGGGFNGSTAWIRLTYDTTAVATWNTYPGNDPSFGYSASGQPGGRSRYD